MNEEKQSLLTDAVESLHMPFVDYVVSRNYEDIFHINEAANGGNSRLHSSRTNTSFNKLIELLIDRGINLSLQNNGYTPLDLLHVL